MEIGESESCGVIQLLQ